MRGVQLYVHVQGQCGENFVFRCRYWACCGTNSLVFAAPKILHAQLVHGPVGFVPPPTGSPVLGEGGESLLLGAADANAYR